MAQAWREATAHDDTPAATATATRTAAHRHRHPDLRGAAGVHSGTRPRRAVHGLPRRRPRRARPAAPPSCPCRESRCRRPSSYTASNLRGTTSASRCCTGRPTSRQSSWPSSGGQRCCWASARRRPDRNFHAATGTVAYSSGTARSLRRPSTSIRRWCAGTPRSPVTSPRTTFDVEAAQQSGFDALFPLHGVCGTHVALCAQRPWCAPWVRTTINPQACGGSPSGSPLLPMSIKT